MIFIVRIVCRFKTTDWKDKLCHLENHQTLLVKSTSVDVAAKEIKTWFREHEIASVSPATLEEIEKIMENIHGFVRFLDSNPAIWEKV